MGIAAAIIGCVGGLTTVMGILTILKVDMGIGAEFTWMFWLVFSAVLFLASITLLLGRGQGGVD